MGTQPSLRYMRKKVCWAVAASRDGQSRATTVALAEMQSRHSLPRERQFSAVTGGFWLSSIPISMSWFLRRNSVVSRIGRAT